MYTSYTFSEMNEMQSHGPWEIKEGERLDRMIYKVAVYDLQFCFVSL